MVNDNNELVNNTTVSSVSIDDTFTRNAAIGVRYEMSTIANMLRIACAFRDDQSKGKHREVLSDQKKVGGPFCEEE